MKILVVCQYYYPENFVIHKIAEQLVKNGHEVDVLTGKPNYGYGYILPEYKHVKSEMISGVRVFRVNIKARKKSRLSIIRNYLSFWRNSKKWIKKCRTQYDIIYSMSLSPVTILAAGNLYKKKHQVPHVVHCVDLWPESVLITHAVRKNSLVYKFLYKWSQKLYRQVDEVIVGSPSFEQYFHDVLNINDKDFCFIPQPSLVEECQEEPSEYDDEYFNILYCGNLGTIQLIPLIPKAMDILTDEKIRFHIIGMGPMSDSLRKDIEKYGLERTLIYHGPMPAKKASPYFKGADALYVSLKNEGPIGKTIPNKLVMSMAFAKPIIATLGGDGAAVLSYSKGAIINEQENEKALAEAILKMAQTSKKQREEMGTNNLNYFKENFSLENITKKIEKELVNKL